MINRFEGLFEHSRWKDYQQALTDRHVQLQRDLENFTPVQGADAGTNLADIVGTLREMATLRWIRDEVPALLTQSEDEVKRSEAELEGVEYASEYGKDKTAGQEEYEA